MRQTVRWWVAGLVVVAAFGAATWGSGVFVLPRAMKSEGDRWVVAAGLGVAVAALVALWGSLGLRASLWLSRALRRRGSGRSPQPGISAASLPLETMRLTPS